MITNGQIKPDEEALPRPETAVLLNRPKRSDAPAGRAIFADDRWDMTPGIFEEHAKGTSIPWDSTPQYWRPSVKKYFWHLINDLDIRAVENSNSERLGIRSIVGIRGRLLSILAWADRNGLSNLADFTPQAQDVFLRHLIDLEIPVQEKTRLLNEIRRLWMNRDVVESPLKLPSAAPFGGETSANLVGVDTKPAENRTERIADKTLQPLLIWSFRVVDEFSGDIIAAQGDWVRFDAARPARRQPLVRRRQGELRARTQQLIAAYSSAGRNLPGRLTEDGIELDLTHLANEIQARQISMLRYEQLFIDSGIPIDDGAYTPNSSRHDSDDRLWSRHGITYEQAPELARHLSAACFVLIAYLSGMRPGEILNLKRGCASTDKRTRLSTIVGRHFKSVVNADGTSVAEGEMRPDPWVVHESVVRAVGILEKLHNEDLLFPASLMPRNRTDSSVAEIRRTTAARSDSMMNRDVIALTEWINRHCIEVGRADGIPDDPKGALASRRYRRTLAWHIVRQPRGLIAAAIQYGHINVAITQGYGGGADAGFVDEVAFESWLLGLETIAQEQQELDTGSHVSGPAATEFKRRIGDADKRFSGRVLLTIRQASRAISDPSAQVFQGQGMHCVMNAATAACAVIPSAKSNVVTPDIDDCRPHCQNIARTDTDIQLLRDAAERLEEVSMDSLAPPIRTARERAEAVRLRHIIAQHEGVLG